MSVSTHCNTPTLHGHEPRGHRVRTVEYARRDGMLAVALVASDGLDAMARRVAQWDPRLRASGQRANRLVVHSLTGQPLFSDSVDAGWRCTLLGDAGQALQEWDGRGLVRRREFDACLRGTAVHEAAVCVERLSYGDAAGNGSGQLVRHDHPAGTRHFDEHGVQGIVLCQREYLLQTLDVVDWPAAVFERDALLEREPNISEWRFNALGQQVEQQDAAGHRRSISRALDGREKAAAVSLAGGAPQPVLVAIDHDAAGRILKESLGNGIDIRHDYANDTGWLMRLRSTRALGEVLQDLNYRYDAVGNVTQIEDLAQPTRYFANQRLEARNTYRYDSLYQLIEATGWEAVGHLGGPGLPAFETLPADPARIGQYTQTYRYDEGNNLIELRHVGRQNYTRRMAVAVDSNRALQQAGDHPPSESDFIEGFDANGNQQFLAPGQRMIWDGRNQLHCVEPVIRDGAENDSEHYRYDASGQRVRKVRRSQAKAVTHWVQVCYLPGLEIRNDTATGEHLQVLVVQAGTAHLRILHWQEGQPAGIANDQLRYSLTDHLGSATLELDGQAGLISQEHYFPFGSTCWWAARSQVEAGYKTVRYSGEERDATGLYYYGARYYAPWLHRWITCDPAGDVDGHNLYTMVRNRPLRFFDSGGENGEDLLDEERAYAQANGFQIVAQGLNNFPDAIRARVDSALNLGIEWLDFALELLGEAETGDYLDYVLSALFGPDYSQAGNQPDVLKAELHSVLAQMESHLQDLKMSKQRNIALVQNPSDEELDAGLTINSSAHGKVIWLNQSYVHRVVDLSVAGTLVHEAAHAVTPGMDESRIRDFWYAGTMDAPLGASQQVQKVYVASMLSDSRAIIASGPDEREMTDYDRKQYGDILNPGLRQKGMKLGLNERRNLFVADAQIRRKVILRNADSLAAMATQFHRF